MTESVPRISVIIPAYNAAGFVSRAIESVLAQTLPAFEVIVVDDGSSDATVETAKRYGPPVKVISQANGGPGSARNRGAREAQGDWLAFLDADDIWLPQKLERQRPSMTDDVSLVFSHVVNPGRCDAPPGELTFDLLWGHNYIGTSTVLLRRSALESAGGFDEDREVIGIEDYNLWLRLAAQRMRFAFVNESLVDYTPAPGNLSSNYQKIARSAVRNAEKVAAVVGMPSEKLASKLADIYEEYGLALLHERNLKAARACFRQALHCQPSRRNAVRWMTTFAPPVLLDWRRKAARSFSQFVS